MDRASEDAAEPTPVVDIPTRPPGVPAEARWILDQERWELAAIDGEFQQWRTDGSLYMRGQQREGQRSGPFAIYHPSGEVARQGRYEAGEIEGLVEAYGSDAPTPEVLRGCCVPENAWAMKSRYERGQLHNESFFDRQGRALLSDGTLRPERPAGVPPGAEFDEYARRWMAGPTEPSGSWIGAWRFWTEGGRLDEEAEYREARKVSSRLYDETGAVRQEEQLVGDSVRHGPYRKRFIDPEESPYADRRIREERGAFDQGQATGRWTFLDGDGAAIREVGFGPPVSEGTNLAVLSDEPRPAGAWRVLAGELRAEGRGREALCAAARAAADDRDAEALRAFVAALTVPLSVEASSRVTADLADAGGTLPGVLSALIGGADPAAVLRTLASVLKDASRASHDFIEASLLLAPERPMAYMTRSLIRIELGDAAGARADAERVAQESEDAAQFLRTYARLIFPAFSFIPAGETPESLIEEMPPAPGQSLEAIRHTIQVYASRIMMVREALCRLVPGTPDWLPPDLGALLPDGPLTLGSYDAEILDETEEGQEATPVRVEEALALENARVPALMRLARSQWAALCWLCWCAGLEEVALPTALAPPADFAAAAGMAVTRYWRAQDAVATGGLRSMTAGVPSFVWEGLDLDGLPRHFADMVHDEYLEIRSVFLYLASPENLSPFQSDLRQT